MSADKSQDYLVWGIKDGTHEVTGTAFKPGHAKKGNENLENWLLRLLRLRERFGIEERNSAIASRIIRDALEDGRVKPYDPAQGKKYAKYLPFWT